MIPREAAAVQGMTIEVSNPEQWDADYCAVSGVASMPFWLLWSHAAHGIEFTYWTTPKAPPKTLRITRRPRFVLGEGHDDERAVAMSVVPGKEPFNLERADRLYVEVEQRPGLVGMFVVWRYLGTPVEWTHAPGHESIFLTPAQLRARRERLA